LLQTEQPWRWPGHGDGESERSGSSRRVRRKKEEKKE
jgi:hypothetical protein